MLSEIASLFDPLEPVVRTGDGGGEARVAGHVADPDRLG